MARHRLPLVSGGAYPAQMSLGGLTGEIVAPGGGTDPWFFARVTGGSDASGYSWQRVHLSSPHSWGDSTVDPATGTGNAWRAPSNAAAPDVPVDQVVLLRPAADAGGQYEMTPWGGQSTFTCDVVTDVACVAGVIQQTKKTLTVTGRDLSGSLV